MKLSAIVLTKNEESRIRECLAALAFADELLVVDSQSIDRTVAFAEQSGARVLIRPFTDFAAQRNFAISQAKGEWVLFIDADERVTPELASEIRDKLSRPDRCVYAIRRHTYFFGRRLRFSDAATDAPIRLFPKNGACWTQPVHEEVVTELPIRILENPMPHHSTRDLDHYRQKVREYVPHELKVMKQKGVKPGWLPCVIMPPARFFQLYFFRLGILDGMAGFQYAILSAYYTFEKYRRYRNGH